ncbi:sulfotransferase [Humidesulfovibrio sp.]
MIITKITLLADPASGGLRYFEPLLPPEGSACGPYTLPLAGFAVGDREPILRVEARLRHDGQPPQQNRLLAQTLLTQRDNHVRDVLLGRLSGLGRSLAKLRSNLRWNINNIGFRALAFSPLSLRFTHPGLKNTGFTLIVDTLPLPREFTLELEAVFVSGRRTTLAQVEARKKDPSPIPTLRSAQPQQVAAIPLLVTGMARAGTTYLVSRLTGHPNIASYRLTPYEYAFGQRMLHEALLALRSLEELRVDFARYLRALRLLGGVEYARNLPHAEAAVRALCAPGEDAQGVLATARARIDGWHEELFAGKETTPSPGPKYFIEKNFEQQNFYPEIRPNAAHLYWHIYPQVREIFLVRDPRDVLCSTLAFNKKRGSKDDMGRSQVGSDLEFVSHQARKYDATLLAAWRARRDAALLVRYEDLMCNPEAEFARIFEALGLSFSPELAQGICGGGALDAGRESKHRTSHSVEGSLGRWRRELDPAMQQACRREFAAFEEFGYSMDL